MRVGISYTEALSALKARAATPEFPEGTHQALPEGEKLEGPEAVAFGAIGP